MQVVLVYVQEAHTDDKWPIGHEFRLEDLTTNCNAYTSIETRRARAEQFRRTTQCPYPVYADNERDGLSTELQAWPDKYYLVDADGLILFESRTSSFKPSVVDVDSTALLEQIVAHRDTTAPRAVAEQAWNDYQKRLREGEK